MARFVRDEKRTYPFAWLIIGGLFAASSVWALYAELVTRVPWQEYQGSFYDLEHELARQALDQAQANWETESAKDPLKSQLARLEELQAQKKTGDYAAAKKRVAELDQDFGDAELKKTFAGSDLDETYYYRNIAEYARDAAQVHVRKLFKEAYPDDAARRAEPNAIYADPPAPAQTEGDSDAAHHLLTEIARNKAHAQAVTEATKAGHPPELVKALQESAEAERHVVELLEKELGHQRKLDTALAKMAAIDGPKDPPVRGGDEASIEKKHEEARKQACQGHEDTRNCIEWLTLGPVDREIKQLNIQIAKTKRPVTDAKLRLAKAKANADPEFDPKDPLGFLVGPFQIQQIVTSWLDYDRDVDKQQVDRCTTCHMGVDSGQYTEPSIQLAFRTHPRRHALLGAHPVDKFGCTACHQGQGRATDELAHSKWVLEEAHGHERWHYEGDHYWEDPLLPVGMLSKVVIDDRNDELAIKIAKGKKTVIKLDHGVYGEGIHEGEEQLFGALEDKLQAVLAADAELAATWKAVVRKLDNRMEIGLELKDPASARDPKFETPRMQIEFPKFRLAKMLGFPGVTELESRTETLFVARYPVSQPVRADSAEADGTWVDTKETYSYQPPNGAFGLQIPDDMRSRFIQALPEIESGCLRCHSAEADLAPRRSAAQYVAAKLTREKAEAELANDPAGYIEAHGSDALPSVPPDVEDGTVSWAPTLDAGRKLYRRMNCNGCHLLEGFPNNNNVGPQLNDISAKVTPEWLLTWLRYPRGWRAKTRMPNLWPRPLDPASKVPYAEGSPEYDKWLQQRAEDTVAIAAYLYEKSENPATQAGASPSQQRLADKINGYANVDGASADQGKKYFEAYGCQGCHAVTEEGSALPEAWRSRERDIAPTLANIGSKTTADWIAYWIENPSRYWHGTSMPNLRLSKVEAASIAKYLVTLKSKPSYPAEVKPEEVKLVADAKLRNEVAPCRLAAGQKLSRVDCGQKLIEYRGCFGCHNINGYENAALIGPELTGFAQKDLSKFDFGYAIADHHMQTTETFAALKLDSPLIFARDRIELRMGDFDLSPDEIRALVVFLKGLVNARPNNAFDPMAEPNHAAAAEGRKIVEDMNCRGCHVIEGRGGDIDGWRKAMLTKDPQQRAPYLAGEGARVQPEWLFTFLRNPGQHGIRPWLHPDWAYGDAIPNDKLALRMPTFNLSPEQWTAVVRYFATWDEQPYPYQVPKTQELDKQEKLWALSNMNSTQTGNCLSCHYFQDFPVERARGDLAKMAPNLDEVRRRLQPTWVQQWLLRPHNYLPYTKMTAFFASVDRPNDAALWPKENDPFLSPPAVGWDKAVPGFRKVTPEEQTRLLRDFLYSIPDGASWPPVGAEASSVLVDPQAVRLQAAAGAEQQPAGEPAAPPAGESPGG